MYVANCSGDCFDRELEGSAFLGCSDCEARPTYDMYGLTGGYCYLDSPVPRVFRDEQGLVDHIRYHHPKTTLIVTERFHNGTCGSFALKKHCTLATFGDYFSRWNVQKANNGSFVGYDATEPKPTRGGRQVLFKSSWQCRICSPISYFPSYKSLKTHLNTTHSEGYFLFFTDARNRGRPSIALSNSVHLSFLYEHVCDWLMTMEQSPRPPPPPPPGTVYLPAVAGIPPPPPLPLLPPPPPAAAAAQTRLTTTSSPAPPPTPPLPSHLRHPPAPPRTGDRHDRRLVALSSPHLIQSTPSTQWPAQFSSRNHSNLTLWSTQQSVLFTPQLLQKARSEADMNLNTIGPRETFSSLRSHVAVTTTVIASIPATSSMTGLTPDEQTANSSSGGSVRSVENNR